MIFIIKNHHFTFCRATPIYLRLVVKQNTEKQFGNSICRTLQNHLDHLQNRIDVNGRSENAKLNRRTPENHSTTMHRAFLQTNSILIIIILSKNVSLQQASSFLQNYADIHDGLPSSWIPETIPYQEDVSYPTSE